MVFFRCLESDETEFVIPFLQSSTALIHSFAPNHGLRFFPEQKVVASDCYFLVQQNCFCHPVGSSLLEPDGQFPVLDLTEYFDMRDFLQNSLKQDSFLCQDEPLS